MDEEGIEVVLAKAIDLRLKISNCIHKASSSTISNNISCKEDKREKEGFEEGFSATGEEIKMLNCPSHGQPLREAEEEDEEAERLLHIRDALESLEHQLSNLQALQQQQRYEREVALGEIEHSRKMLLDKLKEYKGEELEVIQEASAFAGDTVEHNNDLLLPPYPSCVPHSLFADNHYLPHFPSTRKSVQNGVVSGEAKTNLRESERNQPQTGSKSPGKGLGHAIGAAAKAAITIVGIISVLSLSGLGASIGRKSMPFKILGLFQQPATEEKRQILQCPPGRVPLVEDGEARCVVKERVAVPFESVVAKPDVNFGCG